MSRVWRRNREKSHRPRGKLLRHIILYYLYFGTVIHAVPSRICLYHTRLSCSRQSPEALSDTLRMLQAGFSDLLHSIRCMPWSPVFAVTKLIASFLSNGFTSVFHSRFRKSRTLLCSAKTLQLCISPHPRRFADSRTQPDL